MGGRKRRAGGKPAGTPVHTGDTGATFVPAEGFVCKSDPRVEALGELDELNCVLGLLALCLGGTDRLAVARVQRELFSAGADVAAAGPPHRLTSASVKALDDAINGNSGRFRLPHGFVVPGGTGPVAWCHFARAVARRAERRVAALPKAGLNPVVTRFLNRLSSYLFALACALSPGKRRTSRP